MGWKGTTSTPRLRRPSARAARPLAGAWRAAARLAAAVLLAAASALAPPALADETGGVRGIVTDLKGDPLAGVTVVVAQPAGGVPERGAVTGADGTFRIVGLPAAEGYTVRFSLDGFATVVVSGAEVRPREFTRVDALLSPAKSLRETVQVRAQPPVVALEETGTRTRFSSEFIDNLPILGRNYQDVLTLAPGVTDVDGDGNPNIHGARDTDVVTLVDGLSTTDPLTGKIGAQMNLESIQEVEVKSSGASAEYGRAQGGFTSLLTKSGGNDFEGMFKFYWRGSALDGDGAGIDDPHLHGGLGEQGLRDLTFNDYLPFLSLSGPIAKDRAWYYTAFEYIQKQDPVNALNAAFVTGLEEFRAFAKATWQVKPNLRLALSVNHDPQSFLNQGLNSRTVEETGYTRDEGGTNIALRSVGVLSPNVVLEAAIGWFDSRPGNEPNLAIDNNGNGILYDDRNHDGFFAPSERDAGEDFDNDGAFDVWEDTLIPNGILDVLELPDPGSPTGVKVVTEDQDGSGALTTLGGCEGKNREDWDCDGHLDVIEEDANRNGRLDADEDKDSDHRWDRINEDRNGDGRLDDTPFPTSTYPYGTLRPVSADRDYFIDESTGVTSGPFYEIYDDSRRRDTVKADLGVFVPDFKGSHDFRTGVVLERESFHRSLQRHDIIAFQPELEGDCYIDDVSNARVCAGGRPESYVTLLPTERSIQAEASGQSGGLYALDIWKPLPNLSFGLGVRFDREVARAPGYTFFDPRAERDAFDRLTSLAGGEVGRDDVLAGNRDGIANRGIVDDPLFYVLANPGAVRAPYTDALKTQALRHLTRHRSTLPFTNAALASLYPNLFDSNGVADPAALSALGITFQGPQSIAITNNNLAPRLSVSWDPTADGKTKVFATWGRYYDKLFLSTVTGEQGPDILSRYYENDPDGITLQQNADRVWMATPDHHIGTVISQSPPSVQQVDRNLKTPFNDEWTVGFERELAPEVALAVRFIHRDFRDQLQDVDINHAVSIDPITGRLLDQIGIIRRFRASERVSPDGKPDLYAENYFFNQVLRVGNDNSGEYGAFEIELRKRMSRRWEMQGSYVYSRAQGQAEDYQSKVGNDPSVIENEFGYLDFDQRHVVKLSLGMFLPSDWQAGVTTTWSSGLPYSVISRFFSLDNWNYPQFRTRYGYTDRQGTEAIFQSLPRNSQRNNAVYDLNLSTRKNFVIGRSAASVSFEVFNVLNSDDLRIYSYEKDQSAGFDLEGGTPISDALQLDAVRRFGRRFQIGFQVSF